MIKNRNKQYGLSYERKEKKYWKDRGWFTNRCRGSFGCFDLIIGGHDEWLLVQVKSTKLKNYSFKKEIREINEFNEVPAGTEKLLVLYHKGKRKVLYKGVVKEHQEFYPFKFDKQYII